MQLNRLPVSEEPSAGLGERSRVYSTLGIISDPRFPASVQGFETSCDSISLSEETGRAAEQAQKAEYMVGQRVQAQRRWLPPGGPRVRLRLA
jgi:hypothetical protein